MNRMRVDTHGLVWARTVQQESVEPPWRVDLDPLAEAAVRRQAWSDRVALVDVGTFQPRTQTRRQGTGDPAVDPAHRAIR